MDFFELYKDEKFREDAKRQINSLIKDDSFFEDQGRVEIAEKAARIRKKWSRAEYFRRAADRMPPNWDQELEVNEQLKRGCKNE